MGAVPVQFYRLGPDANADDGALAALRARQSDHSAAFWQPTPRRPFPPGAFDPKLATYTLMQLAGAFDAPHYGAVALVDRHGTVDHRSMIMPGFARFPFMGRDDLQIGATFTRPEARGKGLALRAVLEIVERFRAPARAFWYLTDETNTASVAVIRKAGFTLAGTGGKRPKLGLRFLGFYDMGAADDRI